MTEINSLISLGVLDLLVTSDLCQPGCHSLLTKQGNWFMFVLWTLLTGKVFTCNWDRRQTSLNWICGGFVGESSETNKRTLEGWWCPGLNALFRFNWCIYIIIWNPQSCIPVTVIVYLHSFNTHAHIAANNKPGSVLLFDSAIFNKEINNILKYFCLYSMCIGSSHYIFGCKPEEKVDEQAC